MTRKHDDKEYPAIHEAVPVFQDVHVEPLTPWPRQEKYNIIQVARETKQKIDERIGK